MHRDPPEVRELWTEAERAIRAAAPEANWMAVRSPLLPSEWPPTPRTTWMRYHYAAGAERQLLDGVRVSSPYAIEHLDHAGRPTHVEAVPGPPQVTTQGVRPMSGALDGPDPRTVEAAAVALEALPEAGSQEERLLRDHYRGWIGRSGATAEPLRARHAAFFAWVEG
jgi:hypothetical protein